MGFLKKLNKTADENREEREDKIQIADDGTENVQVEKEFLVRVELNPNFVLEKESLDGVDNTPGKRLLSMLQTQGCFVSVINEFCRSFFVISMKGSNAIQCEERVMKLWQQLYPNNGNSIQTFIFPNNGSQVAEVISAIYCGYLGWDDYLELVTNMAYETECITNEATRSLFMTRNYLVSIDSGGGFTTMLSSFDDFLDKAGYFTEGARCYHEYIINEDENAGDTTTEALFEALYDDEDESMREQCIGLDISYYLDTEKHDELRRFIKRLHKLQKRYVFIFRIPYLEPKARKTIYDIISDQVVVREIEIEPYSELYYEEQYLSNLSGYGMTATYSMMELFKERLRIERHDGRFYGFRTVGKIADETVMLKLKYNSMCKRADRVYNAAVVDADEVQELVKGYKITDKSGYDELHELIGMGEIEAKIKEIVAQVKLAKNNDKVDMPCLHMRFTGAPGTGKTTVARIVGKIFKEEGILRKGSFFEYGARSLCGKFVGQTAPKTAQICRDAYGSVLFIDEAYALYAGDGETGSNDYGREAITTLIAEMENHRDDMVVIMAGYTKDMDTLMDANSGLRSRMPFIIDFKSYKRDELAAIFMNYVKKHFSVGPGLEEAVNSYFDSLSDSFLGSKEFANARFVRNLYERTWSKAAVRITGSGISDVEITVEDFNSAKAEKEFNEELHTTRTIGFK